MKRIVVLGGGISGYGSAILARKMGFDVFLSDSGRLADRYGRGRVYGIASMLCGLSIFPSFWIMEASGGNLLLIAIAIIIPLSIFYAGVFGPEAALFSDLFPAEVRYTGISICYQFPGVFSDPRARIRVGEEKTEDLFREYESYIDGQ